MWGVGEEQCAIASLLEPCTRLTRCGKCVLGAHDVVVRGGYAVGADDRRTCVRVPALWSVWGGEWAAVGGRAASAKTSFS